MKILLLTLFILVGYSTLDAQTITLKEDNIILASGTVNGWIFNVCDDLEFARDDIKKFLKEQYNLKSKKKATK